MKKFCPLALAFAAAACFLASPLAAQEHPTKKEGKQEHPKKEHPKKEHPKASQAVTTDDIDAGIRSHIQEKASGGSFSVQDDVLKKTWELELVRVHKDKLTPLSEDTYFACVDFRANDGTMVDVDFFLKKDGDRLVVTDTSVHKVDGKARYSYEEKEGVWRRVSEKS